MYYIIILLLVFAIYSSFMLSRKDYHKKDVCPKIIGIPACYIVFVFFTGAFVAHVMKSENNNWYYGFLAVPFLLAFAGTITEISGKEICPRTSNGTPMCFISLAFCILLIALQWISI